MAVRDRHEQGWRLTMCLLLASFPCDPLGTPIMRVRSNLLERKVRRGACIRHRGRTYSVQSSGRRLLNLFRQIAFNPECQTHSGLLRLRTQLKRVIATAPPVTLACLIDTTDEVNVLRMAIWICGRAKCSYALDSISARRDHPNIRVQREVVRSLRRLSAWVVLSRIAEEAEAPQIRAIANRVSEGRRDFPSRLHHYLASTHPAVEAGPSGPSELVVSPEIKNREGKRPKPPWRIRQTLRRIRQLVRGTIRPRSWAFQFRRP